MEACSSYYWMVAAMERTGHHPHLAHPLEAKRRMGKSHKTDKLDVGGLGILLRNGTPTGSRKRPGWRFRPRAGKRKQTLTHRGRVVNATPVPVQMEMEEAFSR